MFLKHTYFSKIVTAFFLLLFVLFSFANVSACICNIPSVCTAYSRGKKVFIGKLDKVIEDENKGDLIVTAHFAVEKTYKGKTDEVEIVTFEMGACGELDFIIGGKYFVYAEGANKNTFCNRTVPLSRSGAELSYANSLSETNPIFTIRGNIWSLPESEIKNTKITIERGRKKHKLVAKEHGMFSFTVKKKGMYHVKIQLPFKAKINVNNDRSILTDTVKISSTPSQTTIEYDLELNQMNVTIERFGFPKLINLPYQN